VGRRRFPSTGESSAVGALIHGGHGVRATQAATAFGPRRPALRCAVPRFTTGTVTALTAERPGLQRVEVDGEPAYVLTQLVGPVEVGDRVVVNTTAVDLGLGTGGWHVVHWNLSREEWSAPGGGHVLKLRYTSLQADTGVAEETGVELPADLGGAPVVACDLHSQLAPVAAAFAATAPGRRLVYVMTDSAALPLALSDLVAGLAGAGLLAATVTAGQAFGGDHEAVNVHSALPVARGPAEADAVVVGPGPGIVGTGTWLGFSGLEVTNTVEAATRLGGRPLVAVRYSDADDRARHRGVSHHTRTALALAPWTAWVPYPREFPEPDLLSERHRLTAVDVPELELTATTMGRREDEDRGFFRWAAAAGVLAATMVLER
jgi:hypothetical protein